jgi:hypothetical protein
VHCFFHSFRFSAKVGALLVLVNMYLLGGIRIHYTQIGRYENKGAKPADVLAKIANSLEVSSDFLMNGSVEEVANDTLKDKDLLNQFKVIEQMSDSDKNVVKILLDAFITKRKI